jgi:hypothetical protein
MKQGLRPPHSLKARGVHSQLSLELDGQDQEAYDEALLKYDTPGVDVQAIVRSLGRFAQRQYTTTDLDYEGATELSVTLQQFKLRLSSHDVKANEY